MVLTGTLFYWRFEDWTVIEALYFCVVTLTTVGYGDLSPTSAGTQIFTIVYILTGFGVLVALLTSVAEQYLSRRPRAAGGEHVFAPVAAATRRLRSDRTSAGRGVQSGFHAIWAMPTVLSRVFIALRSRTSGHIELKEVSTCEVLAESCSQR